HFRGRLDRVVDERVQRVDRLGPATAGVAQCRALPDVARLPPDGTDALEFARELLVPGNEIVDRVVDCSGEAGTIGGQAGGEIAVLGIPEDVEGVVCVITTAGSAGRGH